MAIQDRGYTAGRFALDIDGVNVGYLKKFSGLHMEGDIVTNDLGPDNVQMKHMSNMKWTPAKATIGIGMGKSMYDWIQAAFDKGYITKNGSFTSADFNYKAQSRLDFMNALITSVTVPKLDGSSKESAYFDLEFEAEQVRWAKAGGEDIRGKIGPKQKAWLCSNFRIEISGLPCERIASVDAFTWKCAVAPDQIGIFRESTKHPAKVTVPDLKFTISNADHDAWSKVAKKWFIDGQHKDEHHHNGRIVFLDPNMKDELGEITLDGVGFKKFGQEDAEANSEKIKRFTVEMYVEKMRFKINQYDA